MSDFKEKANSGASPVDLSRGYGKDFNEPMTKENVTNKGEPSSGGFLGREPAPYRNRDY